MTNYREQVEWVKTLSIKEGGRVTTDCPFCGGRNKFTLDKFDGKLVWNCYRASCNVKGAYSGQRNLDAVKAALSGGLMVNCLEEYTLDQVIMLSWLKMLLLHVRYQT